MLGFATSLQNLFASVTSLCLAGGVGDRFRPSSLLTEKTLACICKLTKGISESPLI